MFIKILLFCIGCFAQLSFVNATGSLYLLHVNGLNTTLSKATQNVYELEKVSAISPSKAIWNVVYNPTQTDSEWDWLASIKGYVDLCLQKWFEGNFLPTLDDFTQQAMKAKKVDYPIGSEQYNQFKNELVTQFQDLILDKGGKNMATVIDNFHNVVPVQFASVLNLLSNNGQTDYSKSKDYVILLPHSQGNIYANNLYTYLTQTERFNSSHISIFGFATPAKAEMGQMACNAAIPNYVTSTNDGIIALANTWTPGSVLPTNVTIPKTDVDKTGHGLIEVYLSDKSSILNMNSFLNITSNNCYKDLHEFELITQLPHIINKLVYDKVSRNLVQINGNNQICEFNVDSSSTDWSCGNYIPQGTTYVNADSLSTDNNGNLYFMVTSSVATYILTFQHQKGIVNQNLIESNTYTTYNGYYNNFMYELYQNNLSLINLSTKAKAQLQVFRGLPVYSETSRTIDNNGNLYIATADPMNFVQVYYQAIGESMPYYAFGRRTHDVVIHGIMTNSSSFYACGGQKLYYLPLNSGNNIEWNTLNRGCSQITGDDEYLFINFGSNVYRYNL